MDVSTTRAEASGLTVPHLVASVGESWLAIPADEVVELFIPERILALPAAPSGIAGLCHLRGRAAAAVDLKQLFPVLGEGPDRAPIAIGLENAAGFFALLVDEIDGLVPLAPLPADLAPTPLGALASGADTMGMRRVIRLDVARLLEEAARMSDGALARTGERQSA